MLLCNILNDEGQVQAFHQAQSSSRRTISYPSNSARFGHRHSTSSTSVFPQPLEQWENLNQRCIRSDDDHHKDLKRITFGRAVQLKMGRTSWEDGFSDFDQQQRSSSRNSRTRTSATRGNYNRSIPNSTNGNRGSMSTSSSRNDNNDTSNNLEEKLRGEIEENLINAIDADADESFFFAGNAEESVFEMKDLKEGDEVAFGVYSAEAPPSQFDNIDEEEGEEYFSPTTTSIMDEPSITYEQAQSMTVSTLKQQLRLRGLKVSGKKSELIDRLVSHNNLINKNLESKSSSRDKQQQTHEQPPSSTQMNSNESLTTDDADVTKQTSIDKVIADQLGNKIVDVTEYIETDNNYESSLSSLASTGKDGDFAPSNDEEEGSEVWGQSAKVVMNEETFAEESPVVDNISRTVIEYNGFNGSNDKVKAYVSASRDALKAFLSGGSKNDDLNKLTPAQQVAKQQQRREHVERQQSNAGSSSNGFQEGADDPNYKNGFYHVEDYSDVGLYTVTGAKQSSKQIEGILFLSDVKGYENIDTRYLCDKIAFECQPCIVLCPDLFQSYPWIESSEGGTNIEGDTYEEWRHKACHDERVTMNIRISASVLRERYGVSSVVVFGTCFGGGRALEAAAGYYPSGSYDITKSLPPPPVRPTACIAWYPTRYNITNLFGPRGSTKHGTTNDKDIIPSSHLEHTPSFAVMAIFAGQDTINGATPNDAALLRKTLLNDPRVSDVMIKVFPNQIHGFAHNGLVHRHRSTSTDTINNDNNHNYLSADDSSNDSIDDAEVASLLSTAWMETYSRTFLPTIGTRVKDEPIESKWSQLEMIDIRKNNENSNDGREASSLFDAAAADGNGDDDSWFNIDSLIDEYTEHDYGRTGTGAIDGDNNNERRNEDLKSLKPPLTKNDIRHMFDDDEDDDNEDDDDDDDSLLFNMDDLDFDDDEDLDPEMQALLNDIYDGLDQLMEQEEKEEATNKQSKIDKE